jgi:hypothetical protein
MPNSFFEYDTSNKSQKKIIDIYDKSGKGRNNVGEIFAENIEENHTMYSVGDILRFEHDSQGEEEYYEVVLDTDGKLGIERTNI